jgi:hypothetical protein
MQFCRPLCVIGENELLKKIDYGKECSIQEKHDSRWQHCAGGLGAGYFYGLHSENVEEL